MVIDYKLLNRCIGWQTASARVLERAGKDIPDIEWCWWRGQLADLEETPRQSVHHVYVHVVECHNIALR
jgi:hypothetical protein